MFKVVITDYIGPEVEVERSVIGDIANIEPLLARSLDELEGKVDDADAIFGRRLRAQKVLPTLSEHREHATEPASRRR